MGAVVLSAETIDSTIELVMVERADALQYQFDSGPCLTAGARPGAGPGRRHRRGDPVAASTAVNSSNR
jgi:hypothetical protein